VKKGDIKIAVPRFEASNGFETSEKNSNIMKRIKANNTKPEIFFRKALWNLGIRYRLKDGRIPGKPDIIMKKYKLVIFIDGDFWHGYNWAIKKTKLKSNINYWVEILMNVTTPIRRKLTTYSG